MLCCDLAMQGALNHCKTIQYAAQQNYAGGGGGGLMSGGGPNGGGGGWQHDLQHLWNTLLGQLPSTTQPLLKAVRRLPYST